MNTYESTNNLTKYSFNKALFDNMKATIDLVWEINPNTHKYVVLRDKINPDRVNNSYDYDDIFDLYMFRVSMPDKELFFNNMSFENIKKITEQTEFDIHILKSDGILSLYRIILTPIFENNVLTCIYFSSSNIQIIDDSKRLNKLNKEARNIYSNLIDATQVMSRRLIKVLKVNLDEDSFEEIKVMGKEKTDSDYSKSLSEWLYNFAISGKIHEDDVNRYLEFCNLEKIKKDIMKNDKIAIRYRRKTNGVMHWVSMELVKSHEYTKNKPIVILYITDATNDVNAERALEDACNAAKRADQAKTTFINSVSHDIRTPINAIVGMTTIAKANLSDINKVSDCLKKIEISSNHLLGLVNEVLDMSKIESGKLDLLEEEFNLNDIVNNVIVINKEQINLKNQSFIVKLEKLKYERYIGDGKRLEQVLMNLIGNAIKYTKEGGTISFELSETFNPQTMYSDLTFVIEDNGIGMEKDFLDVIFMPFTRANDERVINTQGSGLGMAITYNIVKMMGGNIDIYSELDKGSKFVVNIKLKHSDTKHNNKKINYLDRIKNINYENKRVLIVEDNEINMEIFTELLSMTGIKIESASNGLEAYNMFSKNEDYYYDLILMDIKMPVMDGYEATKRIRDINSEYSKNITIIALSANAFLEDIKSSLNHGMNNHISKPLDMNQLIDIMDNLFS